MRTRLLIIISALLLAVPKAGAQYDVSFSHYWDLEPYYNPGSIGKEQKLKDILAANEDLSISYFLLEQFNLAYNVSDLKQLFNGMKAWIKLARQSNVPEILSFCDTVQKHFVGIVLHAVYPISSGKVEGINNMIKTIRRKAYGYRDTEYFFLKIKFSSLRGSYGYISHKKM